MNADVLSVNLVCMVGEEGEGRGPTVPVWAVNFQAGAKVCDQQVAPVYHGGENT